MAKKENRYNKVVDEKFIVPKDKGGGLIKIEAWELENQVVKYSMVYINRELFSKDNGRVLGYDNAHGFHHKHYFGEIYELNDFTTYENQVEKFQKDLGEFIQW